MVHGFEQFSRDCIAPPPNWRDGLSWPSGWVSMVSALVYVIYTGEDLRWIIMQGYQLSWFTRLLYYMDSQPWEDIEFVPKSTRGFNLWPKVTIYPYGLGHCRSWSLVAIDILNISTMISHGIETVCPLGYYKVHMIMKYVSTIIPLVEFNICSSKLKYICWSHNK